jgi:hypothetical protein
MLDLSTQDPAGLAAAPRAAEADALMAAGTFGGALRASPEFGALLAANDALVADVAATAAIEAFGDRQAELRIEAMMGILTAAQRAELERLQKTMYAVLTCRMRQTAPGRPLRVPSSEESGAPGAVPGPW